MMPDFPKHAWHNREGLPALLQALGIADDSIRFVGGFVRDTLLGIPTADLDCATVLLPETVMARVRTAGFKAVPTGIAHGTITAVLPGGPVEITTLRRDIETDGRRAIVAFGDDWKADAARRDFTINALSAEPISGHVHDYFGGLADLAARRVRFIGDPFKRIAEDHLRILRFFRFHARFGGAQVDEDALTACTTRANDLMTLSRERIADELLKILALPDPSATIALMLDQGILKPVLPEIDAGAPQRLKALITAEQEAALAGNSLRRLAAILSPASDIADAIGARLKLSNAARQRLSRATMPRSGEGTDPHALVYRIGIDAAIDRLLLDGNIAGARAVQQWQPPRLPISGGTLIAAGLPAGPQVATMLRAIEQQWIREGFPDADRVQAIADQFMRQPRAAETGGNN